jgi:superfamily II DNA or RNA helicase
MDVFAVNIDKFGKKRTAKKIKEGKCIFPFRYQNKLYDQCVDGKTGKWCATSLNKNKTSKTWAYCPTSKKSSKKKITKKSDNDILANDIDKFGIKRTAKKIAAGKCQFPFRYQHKLYYQCVDGKSGKWCATSLNTNKTAKSWGYCNQVLPKKSKKKLKNDTIIIVNKHQNTIVKKSKNNMENLSKFSNTQDLSLLDSLDKTVLDKLIKKCISLLRQRRGNRLLQKNMLRYFKLEDNGYSLFSSKGTEKDADSLVARFSVNITGVRPGDIIEGCSSTTKSGILKVFVEGNNSNMIIIKKKSKKKKNQNFREDELIDNILSYPHLDLPPMIYPEQKKLDIIRKFPTIWKKFLQKLGSIPYFSQMSMKQREEWLFIYQDPYHNEIIIGQEGVKLQMLQPGNMSYKIAEDKIETLVDGNPKDSRGLWTGKEMEDMVPRPHGSKARRHTLIMIRSFWKISNAYQIIDYFKGTNIYLPFNTKPKNPTVYVLNNISKKGGHHQVGIAMDKKRKLYKMENNKINALMASKMKDLPPSAYKSIIQKIIRFRPKMVRFPEFLPGENLIESKLALSSLIHLLLNKPGSFVPDIQRYVSGQESGFKRLAVSIMEDGHTNQPDKLATIFTSALLSQRVKSWKPSQDLVDMAVKLAVAVYQEDKYYDYNISRGMKTEPFYLEAQQPSLARCSALLDEIRSFQGDMALARDCSVCSIAEGTSNMPDIMDMEHSVDQHWATGITYFIKVDLVNQLCTENKNSNVFNPIFRKVWNISSSINPRKQDFNYQEFIKDPLVQEYRKAQRLYLVSKLANQQHRNKVENDSYKVKVELNMGWLACLVGTLEVGGSPPSLVTLSADSPLDLIAIRRPSRDSDAKPLNEKQKKKAIDKAKEMLRKGINLNSASIPIPNLKGAKVKLEDSGYKIYTKNNKVYNWEQTSKTILSFPIHSKISDWNMEKGLIQIGMGVEQDADQTLSSVVDNGDLKVIRRVLYYLAGYGGNIEINRINRDGGGILKSVVIEDVGAFQMFLRISSLYPAAIRPIYGQPGKFKVYSLPLLWKIKKMIASQIYSKKAIYQSKWPTSIKDHRKRQLWDHQSQILKEMSTNYQGGGIGTFLWLQVGMGKTLIVMKYIQWLIANKQLPKYIVYTLPESALASVVEEIRQFKLPIRLMVPLKDISGRTFPKYVEVTTSCQPESYHINIVTSDNNLRKCENELVKAADDTLFIVDEVHKAMNDSKRTSVALNIASLARDFVVFTGTPVIDSKTYKLIAWLKMIVPYEVNAKNYLVAANSMITRSVNTGIKVERSKVEAKFESQELSEYNNLIPLGLGGKNTNPSQAQMRKASEICYRVCDRKIVSQVMGFLKEKKGVMVVAKDTKHQSLLKNLIISQGIHEKDIFLLSSGKSILLTDDSVKEGQHDYKVVIVPIRRPEGYTLTRLKAMITGIYPSNQATRTQIEGRINRIGQRAKILQYKIVHTGILTNIMNHHDDAKSLEIALMKMAKKC